MLIDNSGENVQELAEPAAAAEETQPLSGENAQESAEPAGEPAAEEQAPTGEQSPEERRAFAERRRQYDAETARRAEQARVDKIYADLYSGQTNPYTGVPIASEADYRAFREAAEAEARRQAGQAREEQLRQSGIDPGLLNQLVSERVSEHPAVKNAAQAAELARREAAKAALDNELKAIGSIDPSVKTLEDLLKMPNAGQFDELVRGGMSLVNAYKVANFDDLGRRRAAAARQAALNGVEGKEHLNATGSRGTGGVEVPAETMECYRDMLPHMTDDEIRKHYSKHHVNG